MDKQELTLWRALRELLEILPRRRRLQAVALLLLMLLGGIAELATIGAVLPFLALLTDPAGVTRLPLVGGAFSSGMIPLENAVRVIGIAFCAIAVAAAAIRILLAWASKTFVLRLAHDMSLLVFGKLLAQSYSYHIQTSSSYAVSGIQKTQAVALKILWPLVNMLSAILISCFILAILIAIQASIALAAVAGFVLVYVGISVLARKRLLHNGRIIAQTTPLQLKAAQEGLGGIRDVLLDHSQPIHIARYKQLGNRMRKAMSSNALMGILPRYFVEGLGMVMIAVLALMLNAREGGVATALPVVGALALGAQRLLPRLQQIYSSWTQLRGGHAVLSNVMILLRLPLQAQLARRPNIMPLSFQREIALDNVSFHYLNEGPEVLRQISLRIPKGERIGFIGKTGSGKSTLIDVIMGLLPPTSGAIRIDDQELTADNISNWQVNIAHVPQHIFLADTSILENIAFGVPPKEVDFDRAKDAARKADLAAFIEALPAGYDTLVGERGVRLSGGQRQRIGIARALYKQSTVLILDEATSALDDATEAAIIASLERLGRDLTVLMIAHRLTTLHCCDRIYKLDQGRFVESGSYHEVIGGKHAERRTDSRVMQRR